MPRMNKEVALVVCMAACLSAMADGWDASLVDFPRQAGESDDSARIQRLIDANTSGTVYLPKGVYELSKPILVTNMCSLAFNKGAVLKAVDKMPFVLVVDNRKMLRPIRDRFLRDYNVFVRGGTIDGNGLAGCMDVYGFLHFTLQDMTFLDGCEYGLRVNGGSEMIANNLYFRCLKSGLAGNVALCANGGDSHYTDCVIIDYTVGVRSPGSANRFTRCHVWGGLVPRVKPDEDCEMLKDSIAFWIGGCSTMLRDCYADTAKTGFLIDSDDTTLCGCWYFNNDCFRLDDITVIDHRRGNLYVSDCRVAQCSSRQTTYRSKDGMAKAFWQNVAYVGVAEEGPGAIHFKSEAMHERDQDCATPNDWNYLFGTGGFRFASKPNEFADPRRTCRSDYFHVSREAFNRRFPKTGPGRTLVVRARATDPQTRKVELALIHSDQRVWGALVPLTEELQDVRIPLSELSYFSQWNGVPPFDPAFHPDVNKLDSIRFCFGKWLCPNTVDRLHGFEIESIRIEQ